MIFLTGFLKSCFSTYFQSNTRVNCGYLPRLGFQKYVCYKSREFQIIIIIEKDILKQKTHVMRQIVFEQWTRNSNTENAFDQLEINNWVNKPFQLLKGSYSKTISHTIYHTSDRVLNAN